MKIVEYKADTVTVLDSVLLIGGCSPTWKEIFMSIADKRNAAVLWHSDTQCLAFFLTTLLTLVK